jgi:hypothetical protein
VSGDELVRRLARYATSTKNVVGLGLAIVALLLHFVGLVGSIWPLVVVGLYVVGALAAPPDRRDSAISTRTLDPASIQRVLNQVDARVKRGVPPEFAAAVHRITGGIRDLLTRVAEQPAASEDVFVLSQMASDYLPATVDGYLKLPQSYAMQHKGPDGRTPYEMACAQLALLDRKLGDVSDAMLKGDSDELAAHGRFLEESFGESSLSLKSIQPRS